MTAGFELLRPEAPPPPKGGWYTVLETKGFEEDDGTFFTEHFRTKDEVIRYLTEMAIEYWDQAYDEITDPLPPEGRWMTVDELIAHYKKWLEGYHKRFTVARESFHYPA